MGWTEFTFFLWTAPGSLSNNRFEDALEHIRRALKIYGSSCFIKSLWQRGSPQLTVITE